ncbi:TVP38/TMEM64 family protein [Streptococcus sp. FT1-55]|uniref:TVP38/TMEM64 family protein n=1 Tax=Streptococcus sp. FT1-55 TaxID=3409805 RepID=UPI003BF47F2C
MLLGFQFPLTNKQWIKIITVIGILISVISAIYVKTHPSLFAVGGDFHQTLHHIGIFAPLLFILVQIIQVVYPVIPGGLTCVVGHALFGPLWGFVYNFTGIFLGSIFAFLLARRYGETFVKSFVSDQTYDKYITYLDKGKFFERFLAAAFILPGFPDDFLCMVAGLSKMSLKKFVVITLISKPATLYLYTLISYQGIQLLNHMF